MSTLANSLRNPSVMESPLDIPRKRVGKNLTKSSEAYRKALEEFQAFKNTRHGQVVCSLCDPKIQQCNNELSKGVLEYAGIPVDAINEYRAEIRGQRKVWLEIKHCIADLEKRLEEFNALQKDEQMRSEAVDAKRNNLISEYA